MSFELASCQKIYKDNPNLNKNLVKEIFEWLQSQPHLPALLELQVILFLHSCNFNLEETKITIENYFTFRTHSNLFADVTKTIIKQALDVHFIAFLPKKTLDGDVILLTKLLDFNAKHYDNVADMKLLFVTISLFFHQYGPANGLCFIIDTEGVNLVHLFRMSVSVARQCSYFVQNAIPVKIKSIHFTNMTAMTGKIVALFKPFLKKEIVELIQIHSSLDTFHKCVPKDCLPQEFGGSLPSIHILHEIYVKNVFDQWTFTEWHNNQKVDESKRIKQQSTLFGNFYKNVFSSD